jgi:hypothetical protein
MPATSTKTEDKINPSTPIFSEYHVQAEQFFAKLGARKIYFIDLNQFYT